MLDIGWSELLIIGVVALVVVGPKDLPKMFRTLGQVTGKARAMAREFQRAMDAAADEAGVKDVTKTLRDTASGKSLRDAVGFDEIDQEFRDIGRDPLSAGKPPVKGKRSAPGKPFPAGKPTPTGTDPDLAARNAAASDTESLRLQRTERAAEARIRAAELRAKREALVASREADTPPARPAAGPKPAPQPAPQPTAQPSAPPDDSELPRA